MLLLAAAFTLLAFPALAQHEGHGPAMTAPADGEASSLYNAEDLQFLHHMSVHHGQALDMAALVPDRADHQEFVQFARYVDRAQQAEIQMMQALLAMAADRGLAAPMHAMDRDPPMAGMLPSAEMAALEASSGAAFERRWLEGMIFHHEGGLAMARAQQLQQLRHGRQPYGLQGLVEDIIDVQRAEIFKMRSWIVDWGLRPAEDSEDRRDPAAEVTSPTPGAILPAGREAMIFGLALDDRDIAEVEIALQDLDANAWLRRDGSWGARELLPVAPVRSGPSSVAWSFAWTPPAPGRYAVTVEAEDVAGNVVTGRQPREFQAN